jgi:hypothetical protein
MGWRTGLPIEREPNFPALKDHTPAWPVPLPVRRPSAADSGLFLDASDENQRFRYGYAEVVFYIFCYMYDLVVFKFILNCD